jgi:hypothetical protein
VSKNKIAGSCGSSLGEATRSSVTGTAKFDLGGGAGQATKSLVTPLLCGADGRWDIERQSNSGIRDH